MRDNEVAVWSLIVAGGYLKVLNYKKIELLEEDREAQIEEKQYETRLIGKGIPKKRIRKYGFAFEGKSFN